MRIYTVLVASFLWLLPSLALGQQSYNPTASDPDSGNTAGGTNAVEALGGVNNTAFGKDAMADIFVNASVGIGVGALQGIPAGGCCGMGNVAVGFGAGRFKTQGNDNILLGLHAGRNNSIGSDNTFVGSEAGLKAKGSRNVIIGSNAGSVLVSGTDNIYVAHLGLATESKTTRIGTPASQTRVFVAGVAGVPVSGSQVLVNAQGQVGILASSRRYKKDITDMRAQSARIYDLRPVTYHYKSDDSHHLHYGLIAEDVARVYPELVTRDVNGAVESVQYHALIPLLLNEIQGQQKAIVDLTQRIVQLERGGANAETSIRERAAVSGKRLVVR